MPLILSIISSILINPTPTTRPPKTPFFRTPHKTATTATTTCTFNDFQCIRSHSNDSTQTGPPAAHPWKENETHRRAKMLVWFILGVFVKDYAFFPRLDMFSGRFGPRATAVLPLLMLGPLYRLLFLYEHAAGVFGWWICCMHSPLSFFVTLTTG